MRNVDCEWLVNESHDCHHKELTSEWRKRFGWWPRCVEYSMGHVDCKYRETLWDMLKEDKPKGPQGHMDPNNTYNPGLP